MDVKKDFPFLQKNPNLVYLDSACTTIKPQEVIETEISYYTDFGACGSRSSHFFGRKTSEKIESSREQVLDFVGANGNDLIWTRNTTEAINQVIKGLNYTKLKRVVTTSMEHHAVLLPLMTLANEGRIDLHIIKPQSNGLISIDQWKEALTRNTSLVVTSSSDNVFGKELEIDALSKLAHDAGALLCIDGAQGVPHKKTLFNRHNIDFLCFSAHKMLGPSGIGALVMKKEHSEKLTPLITGGGTVKTVSLEKIVPLHGHEKFEAGIQNYAGIFGFAAACLYLKKIGMDKIQEHELKLSKMLFEALNSANAQVLGPNPTSNHPFLYSFNFKNAKPHEIALMFDKENIALRSGFFCAQPALEMLGAHNGAVRASGYLYNIESDIKKFSEVLSKFSSLYS